MSASIHVDDYGTILKLTIKDQDGRPVNLSAATEKKIILRSPQSQTVVVKSASFETDGTDGIIQYTTIENDITKAGTWQIQARIVLPVTGRRYSEMAAFSVVGNLL